MNLVNIQDKLKQHAQEHFEELPYEDLCNEPIPASVFILEQPTGDLANILKDPHIQFPLIQYKEKHFRGELRQIFCGLNDIKFGYHWRVYE